MTTTNNTKRIMRIGIDMFKDENGGKHFTAYRLDKTANDTTLNDIAMLILLLEKELNWLKKDFFSECPDMRVTGNLTDNDIDDGLDGGGDVQQ